MIIPSIDIMEGKAVQLRGGTEKVLEKENIFELAEKFARYGEIAVIDLDSALGKGDNLEIIMKLCRCFDCRVGGGIRTVEKAEQLLRAGAGKIIIGTRAQPAFMKQLPKSRLIAALDSRGDFVVDRGWTSSTGRTPLQRLKEVEPYCSEILYTDIEREGLMQGCRLDTLKALRGNTGLKITFAGGITSVDEIAELEGMHVNSQVGMAVYTGKIDLTEAFTEILHFEKSTGLIPTVVQDEMGQVLMLAYSSKESLVKTLNTGKATYFSRSRHKLWTKGETSGNNQQLLKARYDCDRDSLLFHVRQKNNACHLDRYSCFGNQEFSLEQLYKVIKERIDNPSEKSYTSRIAAEDKNIMEKILEEAEEVVTSTDEANLVWEVADLTYFVMVLMAKKGLTISDIKKELWGRRK